MTGPIDDDRCIRSSFVAPSRTIFSFSLKKNFKKKIPSLFATVPMPVSVPMSVQRPSSASTSTSVNIDSVTKTPHSTCNRCPETKLPSRTHLPHLTVTRADEPEVRTVLLLSGVSTFLGWARMLPGRLGFTTSSLLLLPFTVPGNPHASVRRLLTANLHKPTRVHCRGPRTRDPLPDASEAPSPGPQFTRRTPSSFSPPPHAL